MRPPSTTGRMVLPAAAREAPPAAPVRHYCQSWLGLMRRLVSIATRWLSNPRLAIALIALVAAATAIGTLLPQTPGWARSDPQAESAWLQQQRLRFGGSTTVFQRLGLFDLFHSPWFMAGLTLLVLSILACTARRFPPLWRNTKRPPKRPPDHFFETAHNRFAATGTVEPQRLVQVLRRHRYHVETYPGQRATYLFADRYPWAQLGTFATHLGIVVILVAAFVGHLTGFSSTIVVAQGAPPRPFSGLEANMLLVGITNTSQKFDAAGTLVGLQTDLAIQRGGAATTACTSTINSPCAYGGYRFHLAGYFPYGAAVSVRDRATGRTIYSETLILGGTIPAPHVVVTDGTRLLFDGQVVPTSMVGGAYGSIERLPGGRDVWIGVTPDATMRLWRLAVFGVSNATASVRLDLAPGEQASADGLTFRYAGAASLPSQIVSRFPLAAASASSESQHGNVVMVLSDAASGASATGAPPAGPATLHILGSGTQAITVAAGTSAVVGSYEYHFAGQRGFTSLEVTRDPGNRLLWPGVALLVAGLAVSLWVPRRRLWAKVTDEGMVLAGMAGHLADVPAELAALAEESGAHPTDERS